MLMSDYEYVQKKLFFLCSVAANQQLLSILSLAFIKTTKLFYYNYLIQVSKGGRNIPKAFEIFTADKTYILKAKDSSNAQEWVQCLSVAVAHSQVQVKR